MPEICDAFLDAVRIGIRERPIFDEITENESIIHHHSVNKDIIIVDERPFEFDFVFTPASSQEDVYNCLILPLVKKTVDGFYCTALAYGQTGTGKTFTMGLQSTTATDVKDQGMIIRALQDTFELLQRNENYAKYEVSVSFVEIYNEKIYDLLAESFSEPVNTKGCKFNGGTKMSVELPDTATNYLLEGNKNRHVRPTKMNTSSSRSHAIFSIHVSIETENSHTISALHLVDLAGSEGVRRTGHQGLALAEGVHINQGLLSIGKVLQALSIGAKVIPYRDSVLTTVLQDSLNANSYLTLLACVSPMRDDVSETLSTIRFAQNAKLLKSNPQINAIAAELKQKSKQRTPAKNYVPAAMRLKNLNSKTPTPRKRNLLAPGLSSIKKPAHRNTFCTPNKVQKVDTGKHNLTDVAWRSNFDKQFMELEKEEIPFCDVSMSSRASTFSLNLSGSTQIDQPVSTQSYSPIVKKCMSAFEATIDEKLQKMFETMQTMSNNQNITNVQNNVTTIHPTNTSPTTMLANEKIPWNFIRKEIQHVIRTEMSYINEQQLNSIPVEEIVVPDNKFCESTPLFKIPQIPAINRLKEIPQSAHKINFDDASVMYDATIEDASNMDSLNSTVILNTNSKQKRWSVVCLDSDDESPSHARKRMSKSRKSARISLATTLSSSQSLCLKRKSTRLSIQKENVVPGRRSVRLSMQLPKEIDVPEKVKAKKGKKPLISNKVIAEYFAPQEKGKTNKKVSANKHTKAVLDLCNTGSIKEIQILPTVGLKTAYQIVAHRTIKGRFKKIADLQPIFTAGKKWMRFQETNNLL